MLILISWLLKKPADLDQHCFLIEATILKVLRYAHSGLNKIKYGTSFSYGVKITAQKKLATNIKCARNLFPAVYILF